jgi:hypothetical protein
MILPAERRASRQVERPLDIIERRKGVKQETGAKEKKAVGL